MGKDFNPLLAMLAIVVFAAAVISWVGGIIGMYWNWASSFSITPFPNLNGVLVSTAILLGIGVGLITLSGLSLSCHFERFCEKSRWAKRDFSLRSK